MRKTLLGLLLAGGVMGTTAQAQDVQVWYGRADGRSESEARANAKVAAFDQIEAFKPLKIVSEQPGKCQVYGETYWTCEYEIRYTRVQPGGIRVR